MNGYIIRVSPRPGHWQDLSGQVHASRGEAEAELRDAHAKQIGTNHFQSLRIKTYHGEPSSKIRNDATLS